MKPVLLPAPLLLALLVAAAPSLPISSTSPSVTFTTASVAPRIPGIVRPIRWVRVSSETDGRVLEKRAEEHDEIEKGQLILAVDPRLKEAAVVMARARLLDASSHRDLARADLERARELMTRDVSSKAELERAVAAERSAEAAVMLAEASVTTAEFHLEKTRITSPISGVLSRIDVEQDELVRPGQFVFSVMNVEKVKVESFVHDDVARRLAADMSVEIEVAGQRVPATVRSVAPGTDNESRTFKVILTARNVEVNRALLLRPGTTVHWSIPEGR